MDSDFYKLTLSGAIGLFTLGIYLYISKTKKNPHKEKDSEISINKYSVLDQKSDFETRKEKIDEAMLNEVFKILSKYTH